MGNELTKYQQTGVIQTMDDAERAARAMAASGFFADSKEASQALVKVLAGHEMGFGPFASMTGVHVIQGKPTVGANLMAAAVKRSGRYDYRVTRLDDTGCELVFYDGGREVGRSAFTAEDAGKAQVGGKDNWKKFPRNMYFARAMSNGVRWYCPDVFGGTTAYTPDELGAIEDVDGHIVEATVKPQLGHQAAPETTAPPESDAPDVSPEVQAAMDYTTKSGKRLGAMSIGELEGILEWCDAQPADKVATPRKHVLTLLDYMRVFEHS